MDPTQGQGMEVKPDGNPPLSEANSNGKISESALNEGSTWKGSSSNTSSGSLAEQPLHQQGDIGVKTPTDKPADGALESAEAAAAASPETINEKSQFMSSTTRGGTSSRRGSSLELRKMPVDVLLRPESKLFVEELSMDDDSNRELDTKQNCLQRTCLNSKFTLRSQMMLSFGVISFSTILVVVIVCIAVAEISGAVVKQETRNTFDQVAATLISRTTRYVAEDITPRLLKEDLVQLLYETTKDRFYGYPTEDDSKIPFFDTISQSNKYPIKGEPLPLDWQMEVNVNEENYQEHLQERWYGLYGQDPKVSTVNAVYLMPGSCDPAATDPASITYLEGCTDSNNNLTTGGIYSPSPTNEQLHRKSSDLSPIFKTLFEYHQDIWNVGVYFSNSGAGSVAVYPGTYLDGTTSYTSIGCDWLKGPNPLDSSRPILSEEDVARCSNFGTRVEGATINTRLYSPLDRGWCRDQVLHPDKVRVHGPFPNAWADSWVLTVGRAIFDPVTQELVGCIAVGVDAAASLSSVLENSQVTPNSQVSVIRRNAEGTVVVSTAWNMSNATRTVTISELDVGVTQETYEKFYDLVDYETDWNATEVQELYEQFVVIDGGFQVRAHPIPPVPEVYDETYEPEFLVVFSVSEPDLFFYADQVDEDVDDRVRSLNILSVCVGLAGLVAVLAVLLAVSNYITQPLREMNETAIRIIDNFGEDSKIEVEDSTKEEQGCARTELSEIVDEFQRMVKKFSGGAMAKSAKVGVTEVANRFQLTDAFQELYTSRQEKSFKYKIEESNPSTNEGESAEVRRQNFGSNILSGSQSARNSISHEKLLESDRQNAFSSPLFRWIVALIVFPLLLSTITISAVVIASVSQELPDMINDAERGLIDLQVSFLQSFANLRAGFVSKSSEQSIRDLHVLTRYTSWLLFGGLKADTFRELVSGVEECKAYNTESLESFEQCPFAQENHVCDCSWESSDYQCFNYSDLNIDSRYLQIPWFTVSSEDADANGDRSKTSFPNLAYTPNTTEWWPNQFEVPACPIRVTNETLWLVDGTSEEDIFVQGYETTYSRLRSAASAPVYVPLFNYDVQKEFNQGAYASFEADGLFIAHEGCGNMAHVTEPWWRSTKENGAEKLRPELCPLDKYGYDPRCRGWYDSGKHQYLSKDAPLYVTPPYIFTRGGIGQSCTAPLFDPNTNEHVGQILIDFVSTRIFDVLDQEHTPLAKGAFHLLITMMEDVYGADVVIGPGLTVSDSSRPIREVVKARNETCDDSPCGFAKIVKSMKDGESGNGTFVWQDDDGTLVTYHVAYSPVVVQSLKQLNSSDFSRGVEVEAYYLYSMALAEPEASMLESFEEAEDDIQVVLNTGLAILCIVIAAATGLVVWLSYRITISMTEPMYYLLELIRHINRLDIGEDPPEENLDGGYGSSEVLNVRMTMEKLYKIIQCANAAYFAGETEVAYEVFTDALQLFTRLDNRKAMGVASNNLGNTMLTFYRTMNATKEETVCGLNRRQIIGKGMAYFHQSIQLGEKAYDEFYEAEGWGPNCLHFMQHLSNRYFNRAMFLLTVKGDHEKPKEIEELGMRDLQITRDMDVEIVDEGTQVGWDVRTPGAHLEVLLCRIRGHVTLLEMGYPDDWEVDEMLDDAFKILKTELEKDTTDLFTDVGPAGRMQQIEFLLIRYSVVNGDLENAARIAIRMLAEDEFILPEAQKQAVEVLMDYAGFMHYPLVVQRKLKEYQDWLKEAVDELDAQRSSKDGENTRSSFVASMSLSKRYFDGADKEKSKANSISSLRESMRGDVTMEAF